MELVTLTTRPWAWIPPGLCIVVTALALLLVGEGLRRALNPRNHQERGLSFLSKGCKMDPHEGEPVTTQQPNGGAV